MSDTAKAKYTALNSKRKYCKENQLLFAQSLQGESVYSGLIKVIHAPSHNDNKLYVDFLEAPYSIWVHIQADYTHKLIEVDLEKLKLEADR